MSIKAKLTTLITFILVLLIILVYISPFFIDANKVKIALISQIKKEFSHDIQINGDVEIKVNPFLNKSIVKVSKIIAQHNGDDIAIRSATATMSLLSLYLDDKKIKEISIDSLVLDKVSHEDIKNIYSLLADYDKRNLKRILIKNSQLNFVFTGYSRRFTSVNADLSISGNKFSSAITAFVEDSKIDFNLLLEEPANSNKNTVSVALKNKDNFVNLTGNVSIDNGEVFFVGKNEATLYTPGAIMNDFIAGSSLQENISLMNFKDPLKVNAGAKIENGKFYLNDIKINSESVVGQGAFSFILKGFNDFDLSFVFDHIDISQMSQMPDDQDGQLDLDDLVDNSGNDNLINIDFINKNIDLDILVKSLKTKVVSYQDKKLVFKILDKKVVKGEFSTLVIENASMTKIKAYDFAVEGINEQANLSCSFDISSDNINSVLRSVNLESNLIFKQENVPFNLNSKLSISNKLILLDNINASIGSETKIDGSMGIAQKNIINFFSELNVHNLNFGNVSFPLFSTRYKVLTESTDHSSFFTSFSWFRNISAIYDLKFNILQNSVSDQQPDSYSYQFLLKPGQWITNGIIKNNQDDYSFTMDVIAQAIRPKISLKVLGNSFNLKNFQATLLENNLYSQDKAENAEGSASSNIGFNMYIVKSSYFTMDVDLLKLKAFNKDFNNFKFQSHSKENVFFIDNLYFSFLDGQFKSLGNVSFYNNNLWQFSYNTAGVDIAKLIKLILNKDSELNGVFTSSGSLITQGSNLNELISNLNAVVDIHLPKAQITGMSVDTIVDIALKRQAVDARNVLPFLKLALSSGKTDINNFYGRATIKDSILTSSDISFNTKFSSAAMALSLDIKNLDLYGTLKFAFMPFDRKIPVDYVYNLSGNFKKGLETQIDFQNVIDYVKEKYSIPNFNATPNSSISRDFPSQEPPSKQRINYDFN